MAADTSQSNSKRPFDAGDPSQVKARETRAKAVEARRINGLKQVLSQADSRLWLCMLLEEAGPFRDPFTGNSQTFYNCGAQAWAKSLIATMMDTFIDDYLRMMKERKGAME